MKTYTAPVDYISTTKCFTFATILMTIKHILLPKHRKGLVMLF